MRLPALLPFLLLLLVSGACARSAGPQASVAAAADPSSASSAEPVPAAAQSASAVISEPSVLRGFDPAAPAQSAQMLRAGGMSGSRIIFEQERVELGDLYQYANVRFEFPFRIEGEDPVQITVVDSNCGCTDAHVSADWLKPEAEDPSIEKVYVLGDKVPGGARGRIVGTFNAERRHGDKITTLTVRGSFDNTPLKLEVHTFIRPIFEVKPAQVKFGDVLAGPAGGAPSQEVEVIGKEAFQIDNWKRLPAGLKIERVGPQTPTGERQEVTQRYRVTLGADAPEGMLSSSAIATTSLGYDLEIMVLANVTGPVKCTPGQRLVFGIWDAGEERDRTIDVECSVAGLKLPLPVASAEGEAAQYLQLAVETVEADRFYRVRVTLPASTPPGSYPGVVRLRFPDGSGLPDKEFIVSGRIRERR